MLPLAFLVGRRRSNASMAAMQQLMRDESAKNAAALADMQVCESGSPVGCFIPCAAAEVLHSQLCEKRS